MGWNIGNDGGVSGLVARLTVISVVALAGGCFEEDGESGGDLGPEAGVADRGTADGILADRGLPDRRRPDAVRPDRRVPDGPVADRFRPDRRAPDGPVADRFRPDRRVPDGPVADRFVARESGPGDGATADRTAPAPDGGPGLAPLATVWVKDVGDCSVHGAGTSSTYSAWCSEYTMGLAAGGAGTVYLYSRKSDGRTSMGHGYFSDSLSWTQYNNRGVVGTSAKVGIGGSSYHYTYTYTSGGDQLPAGQNLAANSATGDVWTTGYFAGVSGTTQFKSKAIKPVGSARNLFVERYGKGGAGDWLFTASGTSDLTGMDVATDTKGNVHVVGVFKGKATLGKVTVNGANQSGFLARLDNKGAVLWVAVISGTGKVVADEISVDGSGNSYVAGSFAGTATIGTRKLTSLGATDVFLAKISPTGKALWALSIGSTAADVPSGIAHGPAGNAVVAGTFSGPITFGGKKIVPTKKTGIYVAKTDAVGTKFQWITTAGATGRASVIGVGVDAKATIRIGGVLSGALDVGTRVIRSSRVTVGGKPQDIDSVYVAKLSSAGVFVAAVTSTLPTQNVKGDTYNVCADCGYYSSYSPDCEVTLYGGSASEFEVDAQGNTFMAGTVRTPFVMGGKTVSPSISCYMSYPAYSLQVDIERRPFVWMLKP